MEKNHCKLANWDVLHLANAPHRAVENAAEKKLAAVGWPRPLGYRCGARRSNCSTRATAPLVTTSDTGLELPSVGATSAPLDETSNRCGTACGRMRSDVPVFSTM